MNIDFQNTSVINKVPPYGLLIPIAAAATCYLLPKIIDRIFPISLPASAPLSRLRGKIRYEILEPLYQRFPSSSYLFRVHVRDNLYISIFILSMLHLNSSFQPFQRDGRYGLIIIASCALLHFTRLFILKVTPLISQRCLSPQLATRVNQLVLNLAPTQVN